MFLADIHLADLIWTMIVIFFMIQYFMLLFSVIVDLFRDHETSGVSKALWAILLLFFPLITLIAYLIVRGSGMAERSMKQMQQNQAAAEEYVRSIAGTQASAADEIARAKSLLDSGAITQAEFDALKAKALS